MKNLKVIISGGGTGGHIFPAIAIAKAIENKVQNVEFLFVGAEDRMEMEKVPAAGYKIIGLWISGLQRKLDKRNLLFPFKVIHSIFKAKNIVKEFKNDIIIKEHTNPIEIQSGGELNIKKINNHYYIILASETGSATKTVFLSSFGCISLFNHSFGKRKVYLITGIDPLSLPIFKLFFFFGYSFR